MTEYTDITPVNTPRDYTGRIAAVEDLDYLKGIIPYGRFTCSLPGIAPITYSAPAEYVSVEHTFRQYIMENAEVFKDTDKDLNGIVRSCIGIYRIRARVEVLGTKVTIKRVLEGVLVLDNRGPIKKVARKLFREAQELRRKLCSAKVTE